MGLLLTCCGVAVAVSCSVEPVYFVVDEGAAGSRGVETCSSDCFQDEQLSEEQLALFAAPLFGSAPELLYPFDGTVLPSNLELLSLHFRRNAGTDDVYELRISDGRLERRAYFPCLSSGESGCLYHLPERFWSECASLFQGKEVRLELRGAGAAGVSPSTGWTMGFSPGPVLGGLYYWSAQSRGIYRLGFGAREAQPFIEPRSGENPDDCAGCHAVSRDGSTIAYTHGDSSSSAVFENAAFAGTLRVARVTSAERPLLDSSGGKSDSGMITLSKEGELAVTAFDFQLNLRDTRSGALLDVFDGRGLGVPFFPEFSPDDGSLALTLSQHPDSEIAVRDGDLYVLDVEGEKFGALRLLARAPEKMALYYPTWSPDGRWIAYVQGPAGTAPAEKSYDQPDSVIKMIASDGSQTVSLDAINDVQGATTTWPKFAPFEQCQTAAIEPCPPEQRLFFLSFSSKRGLGVLTSLADARSQLWMTAISIAAIAEGRDAAFAPFWIPHQQTQSSNHLGYWTEALRCNENVPCSPGMNCSAEGTCETRPR